MPIFYYYLCTRMSEPVTPYHTKASKKEEVRNMFDNIAGRYDLLNRVLSLRIDVYWRNKAVAFLKPFKPAHILDVACGTGDFSIAALKTGAQKVTGVDISEKMLAAGRVKMKERGLDGKIALETGDSEQLQYATATFDAATVAFGVRNFEQLDKGLAEMQRVLKPGAPIVILEFSKPRVFPVKQLYHFYFSTILPLIGRLVSGDARAYTYLFESVSAFPDGNDFLDHMNKAGFTSCAAKRLTFGICSMYTGLKKD